MGILTRFKDIMASNINAVLDKMENPEKMIDQTIRNLEKDLREVKMETVTVMAEETRAKRIYDEAQAEVDKLEKYAIKALQSDNEEDAKKFLQQKVDKEGELNALHQTSEVAELNAKRMCAMHTKLASDLDVLRTKQAEIKAKFAAAAAQEKINNAKGSNNKGAGSMETFKRLEEKANQALDRANAMAQFNAPEDTDLEDLMAKYDNTDSSTVDDELAKLKASLLK